MKLLIPNPPEDIDVYWKLIRKDCSAQLCLLNEQPGFIHLFAGSQRDFRNMFGKIEKRLYGNVSFWVSWYKKTSKFQQILRKTGSGILP